MKSLSSRRMSFELVNLLRLINKSSFEKILFLIKDVKVVSYAPYENITSLHVNYSFI